jgi:hypothetical protein
MKNNLADYVNFEHPANQSILRCLGQNLNYVQPLYHACFKQVIRHIFRDSGVQFVRGYPVLANQHSGIVEAALCGSYGIALRCHTAETRQQMIEAGGISAIQTAQVRLAPGDDWVILRSPLREVVQTFIRVQGGNPAYV